MGVKLRMAAILLGGICAFLGGCSHSNPPPATIPPGAADFVVAVGDQEFVVRLVSPQQIELVRGWLFSSQSKDTQNQIISGTVADGDGGFNRDPKAGHPWTWHLNPETIKFEQFAPTVCRGDPSQIENNKSNWINRAFCPWSAKVVEELSN